MNGLWKYSDSGAKTNHSHVWTSSEHNRQFELDLKRSIEIIHATKPKEIISSTARKPRPSLPLEDTPLSVLLLVWFVFFLQLHDVIQIKQGPKVLQKLTVYVLPSTLHLATSPKLLPLFSVIKLFQPRFEHSLSIILILSKRKSYFDRNSEAICEKLFLVSSGQN